MMATHDQVIKLKYFKWDEKYRQEKPFQLYADIPIDLPDSIRGNVKFEDGEPETIHDVRGTEPDYNLDEHGFCFRKFETNFSNWEDENIVVAEYYPQIEHLLKQEVGGADLVHIFEFRVSNPLSLI
jgi:hypothetical protein